MPLTGNSPNNTYKDLLYLNNNNAGVTSSAVQVYGGGGTASCMHLSDDGLLLKPVNDDAGTKILSIQKDDGTSFFTMNNDGEVAGNAIKDEDTLTSNSALHLATQQSIKAYVDTLARTFFINFGFFSRVSASNLMIMPSSGDAGQQHDTGATSLTSIDAEALMHGSIYIPSVQTQLVRVTGWIGSATAGAEDLTVHFFKTNVLSSDQAGSIMIASIGNVSQAGALSQNDAYYVGNSLAETLTAGMNLLVGVTLGTGSSKDVSGSLSLEFKLTS